MMNILRRSAVGCICSRLFCTKNVETVLVSSHENAPGIRLVALNRPPVNGLDLANMQTITETISSLSKDKETRGIVITSAVPKVFCGGLDIEWMVNTTALSEWTAFSEALVELWATLYGCPIPIIAALNGHAIAGGCLIAVCSDYRILLKNATIGLPEPKLDIVTPLYLRESVSDLIGRRAAEKALVGGEVYSAQDALSIRLIDEIAEDHNDLQSKTMHILNAILQIPENARSQTKSLMRRPLLNMIADQKAAVIKDFVDQALKPTSRDNLKKYLASLKKK